MPRRCDDRAGPAGDPGGTEARATAWRGPRQNRRLRDLELGRKERRAGGGAAAADFDPLQGIVVDSKPSTAASQALFQGLYSDIGSGPQADFEKFKSYLEKQTEKIRKKTGCRRVSFRVAAEKGKLKLKAKPVKDQ